MNTAPRNSNEPGEGLVEGKTELIQMELSLDRSIPVKGFVYPSPNFLPGRVLAVLLSGRRFTHLDSWREFGHSRLADSIWKLRRLDWPVDMVEQEVSTSDPGRSATIGIYFLTPETIAEAGERGQEFAAECARIEAERRAA